MAADDRHHNPISAGAAAGPRGPYIPAELIPDIARHLKSLHDCFSLRAACRAYRAVLPPCRALLTTQPPCLLVPHSASSSLSFFHLLQPGCPSFSLALFHLPPRRLHRFRARLSFARSGGVLTSDSARVVAVDDATGEILVTHLLSGVQVRLPMPPFTPVRIILTSDYVFAPAAGRTDIQYCHLWNSQWGVASYGSPLEIQDWRIVNGVNFLGEK